jgi:hypothetical protein
MEQFVKDIYDIIKDYREEEGLMNKERIITWIDQFNPEDRKFVLEEMKHILKQRYISKDKAKELVKGILEFLASNYKFSSPKDFLLQSAFIDNQPEGKSQKVLLKFLDEIIQTEFSISLADCNLNKPKYYIYFDDVLCTGDTLVKGLTKNTAESKGWFYKTDNNGKTNLTIFKENESILVLAYFCVHKINVKKAYHRIWIDLGRQHVETLYSWNEEFSIWDDVDNANSKLNFIFPTENIIDNEIKECQVQIENKIRNLGFNTTGKIRYREPSKPNIETFFTSSSNRERFEKIILAKSIEIYNRTDKLKNEPRAKPLGYGLHADISFGFGALIFTWRNVPFNVPLVFWYHDHGWFPLFERKFVSYDSKSIEKTLKEIAKKKIENMTQEEYTAIRNTYDTNRIIHKSNNNELFELDSNFLEDITGIAKKYWKEGYMNAPSFRKQFEKLKADNKYDKFTCEGFHAWAKGCGSGQSLLFVHIIKSAYENIVIFRRNMFEEKGFGKGSAFNTIMLGISYKNEKVMEEKQ